MTVRRPKAGAREALGEAFAKDLWESWRRHGAAALEVVRVDKPDLYVKLVTAMLPKETETKASAPDDLDDAALDRRIASLAAALGLAIGARAGAGNQGPAKGEAPAGEL
ncbi:MAG TPA: hypothetical protein VL358_04180 [Caulobacteraceae bacterium]|nr:hypothetical protein [Caulobacteraceae bacterium]